MPLLLLGGAAIGIGAYWYLVRTKPCNESIFGGYASEYECYLKNVLQIGCEWDGVACVSSGTGGGSPLDLPCNYPGRYQCFSTPDSPGPDAYKCISNIFSSTGYAYALQRKDHPSCNPISYELDCFDIVDNVGDTGLNQCRTTLKAYSTCYNDNVHFGCQCDDSCETDPATPGYCCADTRCQWQPAGHPLEIHRDDFTTIVPHSQPGNEGESIYWSPLDNPINAYIYPMAVSTLTNGQIDFYDNDIIPGILGYRICFIYAGITTIFDENAFIIIPGGSGTLNLSTITKPRQGVEQIKIDIWGGDDIKISRFSGNWS